MDMDNISFRLGTLADLGRLAEINALGSEEGRVEAEKELPRFIDAHNLICALIDGQIAGLLYWKEGFMKNDQWYLTQITIDEKWRRKGIGEALFKNFLDVAKGKGVKEVIADIRTSNQPSRNMMQKIGAKQIGSIDLEQDNDPRLLYRIKP